MIKEFNIYPVTQEYIPQMLAILKSTTQDWSLPVLTSCFGKEYKQWGIFFDKAILGFAIIKNGSDHWELMQIVIDKKYQGQELATRLLDFVLQEAQKQAVSKIQLEVRRSNIIAIRLYRSAGFREVGVRKQYYAAKEDAILMDYALS